MKYENSAESTFDTRFYANCMQVAAAKEKDLRRFGYKSLIISAEREGFEPPVPEGTLDFESSTIDHSVTSPVSPAEASAKADRSCKKTTRLRQWLRRVAAERAGFEPAIRFRRIRTFQARSLNHSDTSPDRFFQSGCKGTREMQNYKSERAENFQPPWLYFCPVHDRALFR